MHHAGIGSFLKDTSSVGFSRNHERRTSIGRLARMRTVLPVVQYEVLLVLLVVVVQYLLGVR